MGGFRIRGRGSVEAREEEEKRYEELEKMRAQANGAGSSAIGAILAYNIKGLSWGYILPR